MARCDKGEQKWRFPGGFNEWIEIRIYKLPVYCSVSLFLHGYIIYDIYIYVHISVHEYICMLYTLAGERWLLMGNIGGYCAGFCVVIENLAIRPGVQDFTHWKYESYFPEN